MSIYTLCLGKRVSTQLRTNAAKYRGNGVTTRPYNFVKKDPVDDVLPDTVCFSWSVSSDEKMMSCLTSCISDLNRRN